MPRIVLGGISIRDGKLIRAIEERPSIYNKQTNDYMKKELKKRHWFEVGETCFPLHWPKWGKVERREVVMSLQKRWCSMRSCLAREFRRALIQKEAGQHVNIKYKHFNKLKFLYDHLELKLPESNGAIRSQEDIRNSIQEMLSGKNVFRVDEDADSPAEIMEEEDPEEQYLEETDMSAEEENSYIPETSAPKMVTTVTIKKEKPHVLDIELPPVYSDPLVPKTELNASIYRHEGAVDQDVSFAMSIVPMLRGLSMNKKLEAQIQILQIFQHLSK